ncbi:hypothetical protein QYE76_053909 [Lolium multiflorum]|uniref:Retrotransposon gag domain-containing protein n=1 Tax=Lolium multiflorum TaxID=4521 RepID=A0AAD8SXL8_LOLMU|nr:hypothetical protein QYE76_053909 [Lolium multiflorum]
MKRFIVELGVVPSALDPLVIYCDNMGAIANAQEPRSHKRLKHIKLRYHSIREYIEDGEENFCFLCYVILQDREAARAERQANLATLQHLTQLATGNANNNNGGNGNGDPRSTLKDFQSTNPPIFAKCIEPLDADDWLRTIENNLEVAGVGNDEKVLFATHFLSGPARAWWENVKAIQAEGHVINWEEFKAKFHKTHIPSGLIKLMKDKFLNLREGSMSVVDYLDKFTTLSRYAPEDTNTEEKKKDHFLNGLHDE